MSATDHNTAHQAVTRLYELVRNGDVDNLEFAQLDSMIYERLQQAYDVREAIPAGESIS